VTRQVLASHLQIGDVVQADRAAGWEWQVEVIGAVEEAHPISCCHGPRVTFLGVARGPQLDGGGRLVRVVVARDLEVKVAA
jgi:hypothetical protein